MKAELRTFLLANAGVSALVGTRAYSAPAPPTAVLPYLTIQQISGTPDHNLVAASGVMRRRYQIDAWASTSAGAIALAAAVRAAVDAYAGSMGTLRVLSVILEGERELQEDIEDGSQAVTYRVSQDYATVQ